MKKKAAMEMSVGTIVTIVLLMSVLILGIFLVQKIFKSAKGAIDMTDEQLKNEIQKLFSDEEKKLIIIPTSGQIEIKHEEEDAIGIGIKNLERAGTGENSFSYTVAYESGNCAQSVRPDDWIIVGGRGQNINLAVGEMYTTKVRFLIPLGTPLCTARFRIETKVDGGAYKLGSFDISVKG